MNDYNSLNGVLKPLLQIVNYGGAQLQPFYTCVINNSLLFIVINNSLLFIVIKNSLLFIVINNSLLFIVIKNSPLFIVILRLTLAPFLVISSCYGERYFESFGLAFQETTLAFQPSDIISCAEPPRPGLVK
jgi:hypothetical protein